MCFYHLIQWDGHGKWGNKLRKAEEFAVPFSRRELAKRIAQKMEAFVQEQDVSGLDKQNHSNYLQRNQRKKRKTGNEDRETNPRDELEDVWLIAIWPINGGMYMVELETRSH